MTNVPNNENFYKTTLSLEVASLTRDYDLCHNAIFSEETSRPAIVAAVAGAFDIPFEEFVRKDFIGRVVYCADLRGGHDPRFEVTLCFKSYRERDADELSRSVYGQLADSSVEDMSIAASDLRRRYVEFIERRFGSFVVEYKQPGQLSAHPFNILVDAMGHVQVRYGYTPIKCKDTTDEDLYKGLPWSAGQVCGGKTVGFHHVEEDLFSRRTVLPDSRGMFDLDEIDFAVNRIRRDWGPLDAQLNIPADRLRRSLQAA